MSLLVRDMFLVTLVALTSVGIIYVQYFAPYGGQEYAMIAWGAFVVSGFCFLAFSELGKAFIAYVKASRNEMRKVVWPAGSDVVRTTFAVGVAVTMFSILVSILDSVLVRFLSGLIG